MYHWPTIFPVNRQVWQYKWYVDAEFVVHKGIRSHTGGFMNMGPGGNYVKHRIEKLNTKNSTDADIFRVDDVLNQLIDPILPERAGIQDP